MVFRKIVDKIDEYLEFLFLLLIVLFFLDIFLIFKYVTYIPTGDIFLYIAILANGVGLIGFGILLNDKRKERVEKEKLKNEYILSIYKLFQNYRTNIFLDDFFSLRKNYIVEIITQVSNETFPSYYMKRDIDSQLNYEIIFKFYTYLIQIIKPQQYLELFFRYVTKFNLTKKHELTGLDENKLRQCGTEENKFIKIMYVWYNYPRLNNTQKNEKSLNCTEIEINNYIDSLLGLSQLNKKIDNLSQNRYTILKKIVSKFINEGYISNKTLRSFMKHDEELIVITKNEASISNLLNPEKKKGYNTPFKQVLIEEGFIQPSIYMRFTFMKVIEKEKFKKYSDNLDRYMEEIIIPKVEKYWQNAKNERKLNDVVFNYGYFIYKVDLLTLDWNIPDTLFCDEFREQVIGKFNKQQIQELFTSQIHRIYFLLRELSIISLIDCSIADAQKKILVSKYKQLNDKITELMGITIKECVDYRNIDDEEKFSQIIMMFMSENGVTIDKYKSLKISREIIENSTNLYSVLEKLGIEI